MRDGQPVSQEDLAVGRRLAAIRSEVGLSQAEVARRLGFAQSRIAKLETGTRRLLFSDAVAITDLYGVDLSALLEHPPAEPLDEAAGGADREKRDRQAATTECRP